MGVEVIVPLGLFLSIVGVIWLVSYFNSVRRRESHETLRLAISNGQALSEELLSKYFEEPSGKQKDIRRGVIWIAVGIATIVSGVAFGQFDAEVTSAFTGIASFPALIGLAFLGFGLLGYGHKSD